MDCWICSEPDVEFKDSKDAEICQTCRMSDELHPVVLFRLSNGEVHLELNSQINDSDAQLSEIEEIVEKIPMFLPKSGVAMLRDIESRQVLEGPVLGPYSRLMLFLMDCYPTMLAQAIQTSQK